MKKVREASSEAAQASLQAAAPAQAGDDWWRIVSEFSPVGIYRANAVGECTYVNERWCALTGLTAEQALGVGWLQAIHPDDRARVLREWEAAHRAGPPFQAEYRYRRPDGSVVWIFGQVGAMRGAGGKFLGYVGCVTDVSELRQVREELAQAQLGLEARVRERTQKLLHSEMVVESIDDAIISSTFGRKIVSWNRAAERIFGWSAREMLGETADRLWPEGLEAEARLLRDRARCGERVEVETMRKTRSGALIEVNLRIFPLRDERSKVVGTTAIVRDLTPLRSAARRLRRLSLRLLHAQDEERRRLARELHDSTAQTVVALSMNLGRLARPEGFLTAEQRSALLEGALELAATALRELRTTAYVLHPPLLDERGLRQALEWLVGGFQARSGITVTLALDPRIERLPERIELTLFRVAQESLSNVHRHAKSPTARVELRREADCCVLEVADDGAGLAPGAVSEEGVGISGMKERLAELGGALEVCFSPHGTRVTARLPLAL